MWVGSYVICFILSGLSSRCCLWPCASESHLNDGEFLMSESVHDRGHILGVQRSQGLVTLDAQSSFARHHQFVVELSVRPVQVMFPSDDHEVVTVLCHHHVSLLGVLIRRRP